MTTAVAQIRKMCYECMGNEQAYKRVTWCSSTKCPLWNYRLGYRPATAREKFPKLMNKAYVESFIHTHEKDLPNPSLE